jgi:hypothetical protein
MTRILMLIALLCLLASPVGASLATVEAMIAV